MSTSSFIHVLGSILLHFSVGLRFLKLFQDQFQSKIRIYLIKIHYSGHEYSSMSIERLRSIEACSQSLSIQFQGGVSLIYQGQNNNLPVCVLSFLCRFIHLSLLSAKISNIFLVKSITIIVALIIHRRFTMYLVQSQMLLLCSFIRSTSQAFEIEIITLILQNRKPKVREVELFVQDHPVSKWFIIKVKCEAIENFLQPLGEMYHIIVNHLKFLKFFSDIIY